MWDYIPEWKRKKNAKDEPSSVKVRCLYQLIGINLDGKLCKSAKKGIPMKLAPNEWNIFRLVWGSIFKAQLFGFQLDFLSCGYLVNQLTIS